MGYRWGQTLGAYKKWCWIFDKELPLTINVNSSVSDAGYVRDVIAFAKANKIVGQEWHGNVQVKIINDKEIKIVEKASQQQIIEQGIDMNKMTLFEILQMAGKENLKVGQRFICTDDEEVLNNTLASFSLKAAKIDVNTYQIIKLEK